MVFQVFQPVQYSTISHSVNYYLSEHYQALALQNKLKPLTKLSLLLVSRIHRGYPDLDS